MKVAGYEFVFTDQQCFRKALDAVTLALAAVEHRHPSPRLYLEMHYEIHPRDLRVIVSNQSALGREFAEQFQGFLHRSLDDLGYEIQHTGSQRNAIAVAEGAQP